MTTAASTTAASTANRANRLTLYRKWRPGRLETMAGQEIIRTVIANAVRQQRLSHAYLLCGPRGTGKTSLARIIAKLANCATAQTTGDACDQCEQCQRISAGQHSDVVELDAATNRTLDDVRRLQDHVHYLPALGRRRVVIQGSQPPSDTGSADGPVTIGNPRKVIMKFSVTQQLTNKGIPEDPEYCPVGLAIAEQAKDEVHGLQQRQPATGQPLPGSRRGQRPH